MSRESRQRRRKERIASDWDAKHREHVEAHAEEMERERKLTLEALHDPVFVAAHGLPPGMPEESLQILARTMAMHKIGPLQPRADKYEDKFGNAPTVLHRYH